MATILQIVNRVLQNIDEQTISALSSATSGMSARVLDWLNETIEDIFSRNTNWSFREASTTITTVSGTISYAIPAGVDTFSIRVLKERNTGLALNYIDYEDFYRNYSELIIDLTSGTLPSGRPSRYTIDAGNIIVWPSPDKAYTLDLLYFTTFTPYTSSSGDSTAITPIPANYHRLIRLGTTALAKEFLGDQDAQIERAKYEQGIKNMLAQDRRYGDRQMMGQTELYRSDGDWLI